MGLHAWGLHAWGLHVWDTPDFLGTTHPSSRYMAMSYKAHILGSTLGASWLW